MPPSVRGAVVGLYHLDDFNGVLEGLHTCVLSLSAIPSESTKWKALNITGCITTLPVSL